MKETLQLTFLTSMNKTTNLLVPSPKTPIDSAAVNQAMDAIVAADIFTLSTGRIVKKVAAKLSTTDSADIALS